MNMWRRRSLWVSDSAISPPINHKHSPNGLSRLVILIHGYNNDKEQAEESYALLKRKLARDLDKTKLRAIWTFFWPGYIEGVLPGLRRHITQRLRRTRVPVTESNLLFTLPLYALQVPKARQIGELLGQYLLRLVGPQRQPCELVLIAHSLGCRVALEAVRVFVSASEGQKHRVKAIYLMAAAVPTYMVETTERLAASAKAPRRTYVLYSRKDSVLRRWFPPGQTLAGEGRFPKAIGRHGQPRIWSGADETMLEHGDYWESPVTRPHLARLFGISTREELPDFELLSWPDPTARNLASSELPTRGVSSG